MELVVRVGKTLGQGFKTNVGVPQGDCLSPLLFIIYLSQALITKEPVNLLTSTQINDHNYAINKTFDILDPQCADDISWVTNGPYYQIEDIKKKIPSKLAERNLIINEDKTEEFTVTYGWR